MVILVKKYPPKNPNDIGPYFNALCILAPITAFSGIGLFPLFCFGRA
jgi:hypothetical protein